MPHTAIRDKYSSLEEFYNADARRRLSGEADYGVRWRDGDRRVFWRVSYIRDTGEVYAVAQGNVGHLEAPVRVFGVFPVDDVAPESVWYNGLDAVLEGWPARCGPLYGLDWLGHRISEGRSHLCDNGCCRIWTEAAPHAASRCRKQSRRT